MSDITIGAVPARIRQAVADRREAREAYLIAKREIWIEWGGSVYGPYRDAAHARQDGFHLPEEVA